MSSASIKRLMKDFEKMKAEKDDDIIASPEEDNMLHWTATMVGPLDTVWEEGTFKLSLVFTQEYPNKPPEINFTTKMFHPNIYNDGSICLDMLKSDWNPSYDVFGILTTIRTLLGSPNPNSPANGVAAQLYSSNEKEYNRRVK